MDSMPMDNSTSSTSDTNMSMSMQMVPYLHFTKGDFLLFKSVAPSSPGAIFGACLILFLLSVFGRWLHAMRRGLERRFLARAAKLTATYSDMVEDDSSAKGLSTSRVATAPCCDPPASSRFILSHELSRGVMTGLDVTLHYLIMLAIMTFNVSYIISIIVGAVAGEVAFGHLHR